VAAGIGQRISLGDSVALTARWAATCTRSGCRWTARNRPKRWILDREARTLVLTSAVAMRPLLAALLLLGAAARAEEESAPPRRRPGSRRSRRHAAARGVGAEVPARRPSLPPVTAQLFQIGGLLEVEPMFAFSIAIRSGGPWPWAVRVEHHSTSAVDLDPRPGRDFPARGSRAGLQRLVRRSGGGKAPLRSPTAAAPRRRRRRVGAGLRKALALRERTLHSTPTVSWPRAGPRADSRRTAASPETGRWALGGRISIGERLFFSNRFMVRIAASELV